MIVEILLLIMAFIAYKYYQMNSKSGTLKAMGIEEVPFVFPFGCDALKKVRLENTFLLFYNTLFHIY